MVIKEIIKYKEFLKTSIKKEFRGKYKKSFLGILWSFLNPCVQLIVYAIVFPFVMGNHIDNYYVFLLVCLIPWNYFTSTLQQCCISISGNGGLINKIYFPVEILPLSTCVSTLISFLITMILVLIVIPISGIGFSINILYLPIIIIVQFIFQLGLSLIISSLNVYAKDIEYILNIILMLLFYLCPVAYSASLIPNNLLLIFKLNPMYHIINYYREILYYKMPISTNNLLIITLISIITLIIGLAIFERLKKRFAEEL